MMEYTVQYDSDNISLYYKLYCKIVLAGGWLMFGCLVSISIVLFAGNALGELQGYLVVVGVMIYIGGFAVGLGSVVYIGQ